MENIENPPSRAENHNQDSPKDGSIGPNWDILSSSKFLGETPDPTGEALLSAMDNYRANQKLKRQQERMQEISEREHQAHFTSLEDLEHAALEGSEVVKNFIEFEGKKIPMFTLKGYELRCFLHAIDYRGRSSSYQNSDNIGVRQSLALQADPSAWLKTPDDVEAKSGEQQTAGGISSTVSLTQFNSSKNFHMVYRGDVWDYGFSSIKPGSIVKISPGDAGTPQTSDPRLEANLDKELFTPDQTDRMLDVGMMGTHISDRNLATKYNETVTNRYDEDGRPILPDFMVTSSHDGTKVSETMLRHAAFFNVPILNLDIDSYHTKEANAVRNLAHELVSNPQYAAYPELVEQFRRIQQSWLVDWHPENDDLTKPPARTPEETFGHILRPTDAQYLISLERSKRMDYFVDSLQRETSAFQEANSAQRAHQTDNYLSATKRIPTEYAKTSPEINLSEHIDGIRYNITLPSEAGENGELREGQSYYAKLEPSVDGFLAAEQENARIRREIWMREHSST